ncbi:hypothetical protein AMTR_s00001p00054650 [Amborella trichopoda]|uniref:Uncharacterized protein n=1 Tax=Amborella trichopoda TaxID=13333 RepID=W1NLP9_AMBTC|nr:hypothetical protein AMTR_s00001p00054650 [Amborella trichopoda]
MASLFLLLSELIRPENEEMVVGKLQFSQFPFIRVATKPPKAKQWATELPENRDAKDFEDLSMLKVRIDEIWP